jgi:hypothetical protein
MSLDLSGLLREWPYEPGKLNVRLVTGEDGESRIQVRLDLGILQMHTEGRPDGQKPFGFDSLLEYHEESDREALEQFRPYITMMRAQAMARQALKDNEPKAALNAIDDALESLRQYFSEAGEPDLFEQSGEVQMLRGMREALVPKLPVSQKTELKARLSRAIEQENYELAAILRDELRMLKE